MSRDRALPSRDREGVVCLRLCHPNRHRLSLLLNHIPNCCSYVVPIPQPSSASVSRPPFAIRSVRTVRVQSPARVRFEVVHHLLGLCFGLYNSVNVIGADVSRQQRPVSVHADLLYRRKHRATVRPVQQIGSLIHQVALLRCTFRVGINDAMSRNVVVPIHGTGFVAVQMGTVARERNQIRHVKSFYTAPSRSRLGMQNYRDILT
jgi:hypothetical protein